MIATYAWLCDVYQLDPETAIYGHRDYNDTLCPGDILYAMLPTIRDETANPQTATPPEDPGDSCTNPEISLKQLDKQEGRTPPD